MKVIYVDGTFDLIHLGHIEFFKKIKGENDKLIVGVISDENVNSYKRYPINNLHHRCEMLRNIKCVDMVIENCPFNGISKSFLETHNIKSIYYGGDKNTWTDHYKIPIELGIMNYIDYVHPEYSTSKIIQKIKDEY